MGRPLFSQAYASASAVREQSEPAPAPYEKWSRWNAFDPDSDEFFNSDNAVYEAFIDNASIASHARVDQILVDLADGISSLSSDGGLSEGSSPMAVGADDPERMIVDAYFNGTAPPFVPERPSTGATTFERLSPTVPRGAASADTGHVLGNPQRVRDIVPPYAAMFDIVSRELVSPELANIASLPPTRRRSSSVNLQPRSSHTLHTSAAGDPLPRTSTITPINLPVARSRPRSRMELPPHSVIWHPSSPPSHHHMNQPSAPSPVPNVARPFGWAMHSRPPTSISPAQSDGPLTNPNARMSLAHIAPTRVFNIAT